jgi:hypothetical protein
MVTLSMRQKVDLVAKDYYKQELNYQDRIDRLNNTRKLETQLAWQLDGSEIVLQFPREFEGQKIEGNVFFFNTSDDTKDRSVLVAADSSGKQSIKTNMLRKGIYKMKIEWQAGAGKYYNEGVIQIQ